MRSSSAAWRSTTRAPGPPAPTDRRYDAATCWRALERMLDAGVAAEAAGFDSFWLTEHHFQHEGYEVVPNGLLFGAVLAERTERLRLGPRPLCPYEIWQAVTSPPTLEYVPRRGWGAVFWLRHRDFVRRDWERFAEIHATEHGRELEPGERRMLVLNIRVESTHEEAWARARPGHDEFWKFLGPYGWSRGYMDEVDPLLR